MGTLDLAVVAIYVIVLLTLAQWMSRHFSRAGCSITCLIGYPKLRIDNIRDFIR